MKPLESISLYKINPYDPKYITYFEDGIKAGFPSPADDFKEHRISLDKELVDDQEATFYARVSGDSMEGAGISDNDLLIIDKSISPVHGAIAVCFINGEFTIKRLSITQEGMELLPENSKYQPITIKEADQLIIWGIVTYVIKNMKPSFKSYK